MKYEFTDDYLTGIELIDKEHEHLFEIANETYDLLKNEFVTDKYDRIVALLEELKDYTKTHFAHEEEYMKSINYQYIWSEIHQHRTFEKKLDDIDLKKLDDSQQEYILEILDFLTKWLSGHIKGADRRIGVIAGTIK
ncbi:MAG: hemerythrin family protein [Selenomonas sp.]|nr:hemerythrin family protein [Selenomonadales bacterium]MDD7763224.1 hemerythrin family protein [Selenomonadales bacterium]MDY5717873.1 hemerythrin family protein [Selenomonas sp.]